VSIPHAKPNEVIDISPLAAQLAEFKTHTLFKSQQIEVLRLVLPAGKVIAQHKAPGEITVQCLEGRVAFTAAGQTQELTASRLLYLTAGQLHALEALEPSSLLVTIALASKA
jgi:quercetin dioxygenase-like cupin family protein